MKPPNGFPGIMASCFDNIINQIKNLITDRKRIKIIGFFMIILLIVILMPGSPEPAPVSGSIQPEGQYREAAAIRFYEGPIAPPRENIRDPFNAPPGLEISSPERIVASLSKSKMPEKMTAEIQEKKSLKEDVPVLTGLMGNGKNQIAIIRYKGISRTYHIGQTIGQYRLAEISEKTAIVLGPQGERVLLLGR